MFVKMSLLPSLRAAKEGTKPTVASQGSPSIVNEEYKEVSGASCQNKGKRENTR